MLFLPLLTWFFSFFFFWQETFNFSTFFSEAFFSDMTEIRIISDDMLTANVFPAVFVTVRPAIFIISFRRCSLGERERCSLKIKLFNL